ncbi:MAG: hypothetical protein A2745_03270 [Candidatus Harrisonbacteria bacterium RIFCSPHIGHO2_01_FULL_44_13]|nr:MAG: hypothetical protein A2745_03270 [Candidatus Harrisonbacteria bacterium RIFCSPHIGHO2_01_FULL_44_13]
MKDATLAQGNQVLNLILQKQVPAEHLQDLLESGLLSDLLCANLQEIKRDDFRRVCGLKLLMPTFTLTIDPDKPYVRDMTKEGWTLPDGDIKYQPGEVELELVSFLKDGENSIQGYEMARRAQKMGANLGQKHAEAFLAKYGRWAPPEGVYYITFPGTVWQVGGGSRHIPYLLWSGGRWYLRFGWLESDWDSGDRLLCLRK